MNSLTTTQSTKEIIELHNGMIQSARRTIADAIRIGQIITLEKESLEHGQFLPWIETLPFKYKTAERYMKLFEHQNKIDNVSNLQEAYKQIESIEAIEKRREQERKQTIIKQRVETGVKPKEWDRSLDYEYNKRQEYGGFAKRADDMFEEKQEKTDYKEYNQATDTLNKAADLLLEQSQTRNNFKERIRVSDTGKEDAFVDAIMDYLEELQNDNRRIEACYNIIKICKNIAIDIQAS